MSKRLHIVSFDVPIPADYGGVIDVFYKIKALHSLGCSIHLHCFKYGRNEDNTLLSYCSKVSYYKRNTNPINLLKATPYVVASRVNNKLLENLLKDKAPVILEGLHLSWCLPALVLKRKRVFVRAHNIEHNYYSGLRLAETSWWRKVYFALEARKLKKYEGILKNADGIFSISENDHAYFSKTYGNSILVPAFNSLDRVSSPLGKGDFALYHGNLSVAENIKAALFLVNIFKDLSIPLIVAGKSPSNKLEKIISSNKNIALIANPSSSKLNELIENAQLHVLPTFQATGIKLKLLAALFKGRHCLVNQNMVQENALKALTVVCESDDQWKLKIKEYMDVSFDQQMLSSREVKFTDYDSKNSAEKIIAAVFN
ncbi:MAG: hypothetical protein ACJ0QL_06615 [Parvicellaceae bacterium]